MEPDDLARDALCDTSMDTPAISGPPAAMATVLIWIPPALIALFKALIESYDNLATLRTEDPTQHYLRLYFAPESASDFHALIDALAAQFSIHRLE
jgi:Domain of unknown function (DUF4911)